MNETPKRWYAVKCVFEVPNREELGAHLYEERVLLWSADSFEDAFEKAKEEALRYEKNAVGIKFLGRSDAFEIEEEKIGEGTELWSLQRGSNFDPESYLKTFVDTQKEVGYEAKK